MRRVHGLLFALSIASAVLRWQSALAGDSPVASKQFSLSKLPIAERVRVPAGPGWLGVGFGSIWVSDINSKMVFRIDPATNRVIAKIPVGSDPELGIGIGSGFVWITDTKDHTLRQIDPESNEVIRKIPVDVAADPEGSIAVGEGSVWILTNEGHTDSGTLTRIDVTSGKVTANIPVKPQSHAAIAAFGSVWVTSTGAATVSRIDPKSNSIVSEIPVHALPRFLLASDNAVWTLSQSDGTLARIDPSTNTVVSTIEVNVPGDGGDLSFGEKFVWVSAEQVPLTQIDPENNQVVRQFVGGRKDDTMRVAFGSAWILFERTGEIGRVDLKKLAELPASR